MRDTQEKSGGLARAPDLDRIAAPEVPDTGAIEMGTVGWDDRKDHFELGTDDNGGVTLVFVTLFRGRDPNVALKDPKLAQGTKVIARIDNASPGVPKKGAQVLVARPASFGGPGMWHVLSQHGATELFPNGPKAGDRIDSGYGGTFIRHGLDGTVSIATTDDGTKDGKLVYAQVRRDGFRFVGPWGKLTLDAAGLHALHHTGASIRMGGIGGLPAPLDTLGAYVSLSAPIVKIEGTAIAIGSSAGVPDAVAKSTELLVLLGNIAAALALVNTALVSMAGTFSPIPGPPSPAAVAFGAAVSAFTTASGAFATAVGAAALTLPSTSTQVT